MSRIEERQEILMKIDEMIKRLNTIRNKAINYEYDSDSISEAQVILFDGHDLKHMLHEAKVCSPKK